MTRWWIGYAAAQATVDCGGQKHRLRWESGELRALDHADAEGERTLAALGGEACACVEILDAWHRHADDLALLVLASRGPTDQLAPQPQPPSNRPVLGWRAVARRSYGIGRSTPLLASRPGAFGADTPEEELLSLLELGGGLPDRLVATVAAAWTERLQQPEDDVGRARARLHAALYGRVLATLRGWLGDPRLDFDLEVIDEREPPAVSQGDGVLRARLPFAWLVRVWGRGFGTISGRFCLDADSEDELHWRLATVGPDFGEPRAISIELPPSGG